MGSGFSIKSVVASSAEEVLTDPELLRYGRGTLKVYWGVGATSICLMTGIFGRFRTIGFENSNVDCVRRIGLTMRFGRETGFGFVVASLMDSWTGTGSPLGGDFVVSDREKLNFEMIALAGRITVGAVERDQGDPKTEDFSLSLIPSSLL